VDFGTIALVLEIGRWGYRYSREKG